MRKPTCAEFNHEVVERECGETCSVDRNPVVDEIIFKTAEDTCHLDIIFDAILCVDEIIKAVVLEILYGFWRDFAI